MEFATIFITLVVAAFIAFGITLAWAYQRTTP